MFSRYFIYIFRVKKSNFHVVEQHIWWYAHHLIMISIDNDTLANGKDSYSSDKTFAY